ncbi:MAG: type II toxin-antitoxin system VapC family toxin [Pirellulaceae bacterium]
MRHFLVDTNHLGAMLNDAFGTRRRVLQLVNQGYRFGTCVPVLCELEAGLLQTARYKKNRVRLGQLLKPVRLWPLELEDADLFGQIYAELRAKGRVLSQVDMMLASLCRRRKLTLLTSDLDFLALPDIRTENWLV